MPTKDRELQLFRQRRSYHKRMSTEEGREKERLKNKKSKKARRRKVFDILGRRCVCCGETDEIYLEVNII